MTLVELRAASLAAVVDVAIDALDASRFAVAFDALAVYTARRAAGEHEPYHHADTRMRSAWGELAVACGPDAMPAWRLARVGL